MSRVVSSIKVTALPVHAAFGYPLQPEFSFTDFLYQYGAANIDESQIETDAIAECITTKSKFVPHCQFIAGWDTIADLNWPSFHYDRRRASPKYSPYNLWWELTTHSWSGLPRYDYGLRGSADNTGTTGEKNPYLYARIHPDFLNSTFHYGHVQTQNTIIVRTYFQHLKSFDSYGNPRLGERPDVQGFWLRMVRGNYDGVLSWTPTSLAQGFGMEQYWSEYSSFINQEGYCAVRFRVGCGQDQMWFEIVFPSNGPPEFYYTNDPLFISKTFVQNLKFSADMISTFGQTTTLDDTVYTYDVDGNPTGIPEWRFTGSKTEYTMKVKLIGGILQVIVYGDVQPLVWSVLLTRSFDHGGGSGTVTPSAPAGDCYFSFAAGDPIGLIEEARLVFTTAAVIEWDLHPMKWEPLGEMTSRLVNLGFVPLTKPDFTFHKAFFEPNGVGISGKYALEGTNIRYSVLLENPAGVQASGGEFSDVTAAVRAVTVHLPEVARETLGVPVELYPEHVNINQVFNPSDLSVVTSASLIFNNFGELADKYADAPHRFWGEHVNYRGVFAVAIDVLIDEYTESGGDLIPFKTTGWQRVFTGYSNLKNQTTVVNGTSKFMVECSGREAAMMTAKFNLPWMDGWNEYYAAAYLANISGVKRGTVFDTDLAFRGSVPNDPYDESPDTNAYFLPMGSGGTPLMRMAAGSRPWQMLGKIGSQSGFIRYFDVFGKFHYEKFTPNPQFPEIKFFVQHNSPEPFSASEAVFQGVISRDLTGVRNRTTLIGIDAFGPIWQPLVSHRSDEASVYEEVQSIWDQSTANYLGFDNAFVQVDSQFADRRYISDAATRMHEYMRLPMIVGSYKVWHNPGIYPGRWVGVVDVKSGTWDRETDTFLTLLIMSAQHVFGKGLVPTTDMSVRFIPKVAL